MPTLFRKSFFSLSDAAFNERTEAAAEQAIEAYAGRLKLLPHDTRLYEKREKLVKKRINELHHLAADKHGSDRNKKIKAFTETLEAATRLLDELQLLKKAINDPDNDISKKKLFKDTDDKILGDAAKAFIPSAKEVYENGMELSYDILTEHDLHQSKDKEDFSVASRSIHHARIVVENPKNKNAVAVLLQDTKALSKHWAVDYWRVFLSAVSIFAGYAMAVAGELMFLSGVLVPLGIAIFAAGVALALTGASMLGAQLGKKDVKDDMIERLNDVVNHAAKLLPKPSTTEAEHHEKAIPHKTMRRASV